MTVKDVSSGFEARAALLAGVNVVARAARVTLGPRGRSVIVEQPWGPPQITRDGATVADAIDLAGPLGNVGAQLIKAAAARTHDQVGDGTTTTTVLAEALVRGGMRGVAAGLAPMALKRGVDRAVAAVLVELAAMSRPVDGSAEIARVATVSANGEREVGQLIADAMDKVGRHGVVTVEDHPGRGTEIELVEGLRFDGGWLSAYFCTDMAKMRADLANCLILLHEGRLARLPPLLPLLEAVADAERPLLIIADDIEGEALALLALNKLRGGLQVAAVRSPGFGEGRKAWLADLEVLTGGQLIAPDLGTRLEDVGLAMLGTARKVTITRDETTLIGGGGDPAAIDARVAQLRTQATDAGDEPARDTLLERQARLAGGVAILRVGGATEIEVQERRDRVDDALSATRAAMEEGVLAGGGAALVHAGKALAGLGGVSAEERAALAIVRRALEAPLRQIAGNAGLDGGPVVARVVETPGPGFGFDAQTGRYGDLIADGIVDPAKVVRVALQSAASVAGLLITTETVIARKVPRPGNIVAHRHQEGVSS